MSSSLYRVVVSVFNTENSEKVFERVYTTAWDLDDDKTGQTMEDFTRSLDANIKLLVTLYSAQSSAVDLNPDKLRVVVKFNEVATC